MSVLCSKFFLNLIQLRASQEKSSSFYRPLEFLNNTRRIEKELIRMYFFEEVGCIYEDADVCLYLFAIWGR